MLEALIACNRQRDKTNEQRMNETAARDGIERERAKRRQAEQAKQNQPQAKKLTVTEAILLCQKLRRIRWLNPL
jgi:hypothetical protein